jgi:hypothetical protein
MDTQRVKGQQAGERGTSAMRSKNFVDGELVEWGEKFFDTSKFWGGAGKGSVARKAGGGTRRRTKKSTGGGGGSVTRVGGRLEARAVRAKLRAIVSRAPQVMVKVYGGGKGAKQVREHLRYIGRKGEVEIEDRDGFRTAGKEDIDRLAAEFKEGIHDPMPEVGSRREAINVVLSMPAGTDPVAVKKAARDFAAREFQNHLYAMALHTQDTPHFDNDKNDPPSAHPHVHIIVKTEGLDGSRLNPRKADLQRWREGFAQALRENGVEAVATSRAHRLERGRGDRREVRQMKDQKKPFTRKTRGAADQQRVRKAKDTEKAILQRYAAVTLLLGDSEDATDRVLARELATRFGLELPPPERPADRKPRLDEREAPRPERKRTGTDDLER